MYLAALPTCSKYRRDGKEDVIQTFSPDLMHGANEARFRSFINKCLCNKFNTLYAKWRKRPLSNPANLPFEAEAEHGASDEFCHSHSEYLRQAGYQSREQAEQRFRLDKFVRFGEPSIPGLRRFVGAFGETGSWKEASNLIGLARCEFGRRSVRQLAMRMM